MRKHLNGFIHQTEEGIIPLRFEDRGITDDDLDLTEGEVMGLFALAGLKVSKVWEMANPYWPRCPRYYETILTSPWYLVKTEYGLVEIGWRKSVIAMDWSDTGIAAPALTADDVTKGEYGIHAYGKADALKYLTALGATLAQSRQRETLV